MQNLISTHRFVCKCSGDALKDEPLEEDRRLWGLGGGTGGDGRPPPLKAYCLSLLTKW